MKENSGSKLPKFSRTQSEQLIKSMDFLGINYYTILYVKDHPHDAPSDERDFMADMSAKAICECPMCCFLDSIIVFCRVYSHSDKT
jgi:beta-glucosidase